MAGIRRQIYDSSAAFRSEIPATNAQQVVQEFQICGTRSDEELFIDRTGRMAF
jgi:hypothetical protein